MNDSLNPTASPMSGFSPINTSPVEAPAPAPPAPPKPPTAPPETSDTPPEAVAVQRKYMVLEQRQLSDMVAAALQEIDDVESVDELVSALARALRGVTIFEPLGLTPARNTDDAKRIVMKERFGDAPGSLDLLAVSEKSFRVSHPTNNVRTFVSL